MEGVERVVTTFEPAIRRWFARRLVNEADAEDAVQETIIAILRAYPSFEARSSLRTWVYAICRNQLYRMRKVHSRVPAALDEEPPDTRPDDPEALLDLRMAADSLPPRLRTVYQLRFVKSMKVTEIARFLQRSEGTVKFQLHQIRSVLRGRLDDRNAH